MNKMCMAVCVMTYGTPYCAFDVKINYHLFEKIQTKRISTISRKLTYNGKTKTLREWSKLTGIDYELLRSRIYSGWSTERIFTEPRHKTHDDILGYKLEMNGESMSIKEISEKYGISPILLYKRAKRDGIHLDNILKSKRILKTKRTVNGESLSLREWAEKLRIDYHLLRQYIYGKKVSLDDIVNGKVIPEKSGPNLFLNGKATTILELSKITGINRQFIKEFLKTKSVDDLLEYSKFYSPIKKFTYKNQTMTLKEFSELYDIKYITLRTRVYQRKWDITRALETPVISKKPRPSL